MKLLRRIVTAELPWVLGYPALLWQVFFLYLPLIILCSYSFLSYDVVSGLRTISFDQYRQLMQRDYLLLLWNSLATALLTSIFCLLLAYPVAYFLVLRVSPKYRSLLVLSVILPSWTSLIVQIYSWMFLLNNNGLLHRLLCFFGIINTSTSLLNNYFSILVSMVSVYLPFMILPIFSVMRKIDNTLLEASADLGANRFQTLRRIVFPLSLPGIYVGTVLVFLPAFGEFAIPTLLGGSRDAFWGNLIVQKFLRSHDWSSGAALALAGIAFVMLLFVVMYVLLRCLGFVGSKYDRE